jgi:glycerophosphoryl diester phosphodiesterase
MRVFFFAVAIVALAVAPDFLWAAKPPGRPSVIAHRGASGYLPEHTLAAYTLAIEQGADFIEPDLVITRDGVLIARHENDLADTTDVAAKFPDRKTAKDIDGRHIEGWFAEDFTLAEIKTLRARERLPFRNHAADGLYEIATFDEILALRAAKSAEQGREIGVYPETKHPTYFASIGLPLEERLAAALRKAGLDRRDAPVFVQSFEPGSLRTMAKLSAAPRVQLLGERAERPFDLQSAGKATTTADMITPAGLAEIATYAQGIGPAKALIVPPGDNGPGRPTDLVARAHRHKLLVHPYTFRPEPQFYRRFAPDFAAELCAMAAQHVDGLFTDTPDVALKAFAESCPMPRG